MQNNLGGSVNKKTSKKILVWNQGYPILVDTGARPESVIQPEFPRVKPMNVFNSIIINTYDSLVNQRTVPPGQFKYTPSPEPTPIVPTKLTSGAAVRGPAKLAVSIPSRTRSAVVRRK